MACLLCSLSFTLPPTTLQGAAGVNQQQVLQKDALPSPPASPVAKRPPSAGRHALQGTL